MWIKSITANPGWSCFSCLLWVHKVAAHFTWEINSAVLVSLFLSIRLCTFQYSSIPRHVLQTSIKLEIVFIYTLHFCSRITSHFYDVGRTVRVYTCCGQNKYNMQKVKLVFFAKPGDLYLCGSETSRNSCWYHSTVCIKTFGFRNICVIKRFVYISKVVAWSLKQYMSVFCMLSWYHNIHLSQWYNHCVWNY